MSIDKSLTFVDGAITAGTGTAPASSYDVVDFKTEEQRSTFSELWCVVNTKVDTTSGGAATVNVQIVEGDGENPTAVIAETGAKGLSDLQSGDRQILKIPAGVRKRYLGIRTVVATAALTASDFLVYVTPQNPYISISSKPHTGR